MNIGLFTDSYFPMVDGVAMVVDNYAKCLSKHANVTVFATNNGDYDFSHLPYKVVRCMAMSVPQTDYRLSLTFLDYAFYEQLKIAELDLVHIHTPGTVGMAGLKYAKKNSIPSLASIHSQYDEDVLKLYKSKWAAKQMTKRVISIYDSADECWTVNNGMARKYTEDYGGKVTPKVIYNATDFLPCDDEKSARTEVNEMFGFTDEKVLLYVGRINYIKNIEMIPQAIRFLKDKGHDCFKMLIIGTGPDEEAFKAKIEQLGVQDSFVFGGRITDRELLARIYSRADLFVLPSLYDTNSLVQIEAAAQKTATLFIRNSMTSTTVTEGVNGYCCENSSQDMAEKLEQIFSDEKAHEAISKNSFNDLYSTWEEVILKAYAHSRSVRKISQKFISLSS